MDSSAARKVLKLRLEKHCTFASIARKMGYSTRERARQNFLKALRRK
jgi:hypothetical protein